MIYVSVYKTERDSKIPKDGGRYESVFEISFPCFPSIAYLLRSTVAYQTELLDLARRTTRRERKRPWVVHSSSVSQMTRICRCTSLSILFRTGLVDRHRPRAYDYVVQ